MRLRRHRSLSSRLPRLPRLRPQVAFALAALFVGAAWSEPASALVGTASSKAEPAFEVARGNAVRGARTVTWGAAPKQRAAVWTAFERATGGAFDAGWDAATGVPVRLWGRGLDAPGSVASPKKAEVFARSFLAQHLALLAPGADLGDFVLVANVEERGLRTLGFVQQRRGLAVLGGQVSFRFKNDRLFLVGSEAMPHVLATPPSATWSDDALRGRALAWMQGTSADLVAGAVDAQAIVLPLVREKGSVDYRTVRRVVVDATSPIGRWDVYLDATTGEPVARQQTLRFDQGTLLYNTPDRYPLATRSDYPAPNVDITLDGAPSNTDASGLFNWATGVTAQGVARLTGQYVDVKNDAGGEATQSFSVDPGGSFTWDASASATVDAQLTGYVHASKAKEHVRVYAPLMSWLNQQIPVTVNINDQCNAYSDGNSINFYKSSNYCENTGRIPDVIYHEFGHSFHAHAIIPGVGAFEGALSEGISDFMAASITGDSGTARGFFYSDEPLRELDPPNFEYVWPDDVGEIHDTGRIIGGALFDLRKALVAKLGDPAGADYTNVLFYELLKRSVDIPTTYLEVVAADDDDGDLENGTPNVCEINDAFGAHGLRAIGVTSPTLGAVVPSAAGYTVSVAISGLFAQCPNDVLDGLTLDWRLREDKMKTGSLAMAQSGEVWQATIPDQEADQVVQYRVTLKLGDGTTRSYPDNLADPWYELYIGETTPIYCTDFNGDPMNDGWTHGLVSGGTSEGADDWQWGTLGDQPASGDPPEAYTGFKVFGNDLGKGNFNGNYQSDKVNYAATPVIDVSAYDVVRVQYYRWLAIEDGYFDQATIYANDTEVWSNLNSNQGDSSSTHHVDKEWRFQDVDVSDQVKDGQGPGQIRDRQRRRLRARRLDPRRLLLGAGVMGAASPRTSPTRASR
jgi:hypothetical protein